jgi:uncharacterized damage-inducible protein DinB
VPTARDPFAAALAVFMRDTAGRRNWGHIGLAAILKEVRIAQAQWKPSPDAHSIWEEVNHITHWSRFVLDRLEGRGTRTRQAWPRGRGGDAAWRRAVGETAALHAALARRIASLDHGALTAGHAASRYSRAQLVLGCVAHIAYHVGQIALLRRLYRHAGRPA